RRARSGSSLDPRPRVSPARRAEISHARSPWLIRLRSRPSTRTGSRGVASNRGYLKSCGDRHKEEKEEGVPAYSTGTFTGFDSGVGCFFGTRTSRRPSFRVADARSAFTFSGKPRTRWRAW